MITVPLTLLAAALLRADSGPVPPPAPILDWKLVSDRDEIRIYRSAVPGTAILGFRGDGIVHAPLLKVAHVISDPTRGTEWIDSLVDSHVVRKLSDTSFIEYDRMGMPPIIMKDRDFVSLVNLGADSATGRVVISYRSVEDALVPPIRRFVRGDLVLTRFTLTPLAPDRTEVDAEIVCDPKGWVPKFLVNWFQAGWPRDTMQGLRAQSAKPDVTDDPVLKPLLTPRPPAEPSGPSR